MVTNDNEMITKKCRKKSQTIKPYTCGCGKTYLYSSGLSRHKKKCLIESSEKINITCTVPTENSNSNNSNINPITSELIIELIRDNKEMKQLILEQNSTIHHLMKTGITNNYTNSLNNNNNKTFNLQFFLNETCKEAMNINEFVDSIKLQLSDLERLGELGYTQGISNIITTNLKALDVTQRPVHCTDKKRETMYVKDENKWEKDVQKTRLRKAIKQIANKNIRLLSSFRESNPDYNRPETIVSDKYNKMVIEVMGGSGNDHIEKENKIIQNITKCTTIKGSIE
jgi:hypothetical protein